MICGGWGFFFNFDEEISPSLGTAIGLWADWEPEVIWKLKPETCDVKWDITDGCVEFFSETKNIFVVLKNEINWVFEGSWDSLLVAFFCLKDW